MTTDVSQLPSAAQQIAQYLIAAGYPQTVCLLPQSAHTAQQAADALGCQVAEIAKSIVFRGTQDDQAVLVITSGVNRVDVKKVAHITGEITRADPEFVKQKTGYVIGGVSPLKHATPTQLLLDQDLFKFEITLYSFNLSKVFASTSFIAYSFPVGMCSAL